MLKTRFTVEQVRKSKSLSINAMAKALGIAPATYRQKELSPDEFKLSEIIKIAELCDVPCENIVFLPQITIKISIEG